MQGNPWFWGGLSRGQFEEELRKNAVQLIDGKSGLPPRKKVDIEAIKARKNALAAKGLKLKPITTSAQPPSVR